MLGASEHGQRPNACMLVAPLLALCRCSPGISARRERRDVTGSRNQVLVLLSHMEANGYNCMGK